jgi:hypothetical protein
MIKTRNIRHVALLIAAGLVASLPARPGLAQEAGFEAYNFSGINVPCTGPIGLSSSSCDATSLPIPMGKRLLIQHVTAVINGSPWGTSYHLTVSTIDPMGVKSLMAFISDAPNAEGNFTRSQQILGYADGAPIGASTSGATVNVHIDTDADLTGLNWIFGVTGTLLDCNGTPPCPPIVTK